MLAVRTPIRGSPLRTEAGRTAYKALVNRGPLARIFEDPALRLASAKGGSDPRFRDYSDQSYFAHALNVSTVASQLFEAACLSLDAPPSESELRTILVAGVLHDINKLVGSPDLFGTLHREEDLFARVVGEYVPKAAHEIVKHFILQTENTTSRDARAYQARDWPEKKASLAAWCLKLADALAGGKGVDADRPDLYVETAARHRRDCTWLPEVHVQPYAAIPQVALARDARDAFVDHLGGRGDSWILHETERFCAWIGSPFEVGNLKFIRATAIAASAPDLREAFQKSEPSHNRVNWGWTAYHNPTPTSIDAFIEQWGGRLVLWQDHEAWAIPNHAMLVRLFPAIRYEPEKARVKVELSAVDDAAPAEAKAERARTKLLIAHCILAGLSPEAPPEIVVAGEALNLSGLRGVMVNTARGIVRAIADREDTAAYQRVLDDISVALTGSRGVTIQADVAGRVIGTEMAHLVRENPCVLCGAEGTSELKAEVAFGLKPTAWGPRKKGVQKESANGWLCNDCVADNQRRSAVALATHARDLGQAVTLHVHVSDLVGAADFQACLASLQSEGRMTADGKITLFPRRGKPGSGDAPGQVVPLKGHVSVPIKRPEGIQDALYRLKDIIDFSFHTSFKVHISPLTFQPTLMREQFVWSNAPALISGMGLARFRIDEVAQKRRVVEALLQAGRQAGGDNGHAKILAAMSRSPLAIYDLSAKDRPPSEDPDYFLNVLEDEYVDKQTQTSLQRIAHAYARFNPPTQKWSANTWTWATRMYLDLAEKFHGRPGRDDLILGELRAVAERADNPRQGLGKALTGEVPHVGEFVQAMDAFLQDFTGGKPPVGADRRALINAISHIARRDYRTIWPKKEEQE